MPTDRQRFISRRNDRTGHFHVPPGLGSTYQLLRCHPAKRSAWTDPGIRGPPWSWLATLSNIRAVVGQRLHLYGDGTAARALSRSAVTAEDLFSSNWMADFALPDIRRRNVYPGV